MKKKVLVCDDDEAISEVIKIMLETNGFEVLLLKNGQAIKKRVLEFQPDVILLDVWMPGITGPEATKLLKRDPDLCKIPVIIVSALNDTKTIAGECGSNDYLLKPFEMDTLISLVKKHTAWEIF